MSLIIIHNLIVFALVIRVLVTSRPGHAAITSTLTLSCFHSALNLTLLSTCGVIIIPVHFKVEALSMELYFRCGSREVRTANGVYLTF